jgi:transposase-like protein
MADKNLRAEVKARISALTHNGGGSLRGAARLSGIRRPTLWAWRQGLQTPQDSSLAKLRELTS